VKRLMDLAIVAVAAPVWVPLLLLIALCVRVVLGRPVFFLQARAGWRGRPFRIVKFRTMTEARGADGRLLPDVRRLTPFTRALRATSLDELPELWNVLKGDMSLVGPRPLLREYLPRYSPAQARRHEVRPGIAGLAQVSGRNTLGWEEKFALDVWYVDHRSLRLDLSILWRTVWSVLRREGIDHGAQETMPVFGGSETRGE